MGAKEMKILAERTKKRTEQNEGNAILLYRYISAVPDGVARKARSRRKRTDRLDEMKRGSR